MNRTLIIASTIIGLASAYSFADERPSTRPVIIHDYGNTRPSGIPDLEELRKLAYQMRVPISELIDFSPYSFPIYSAKVSLGNLAEPIEHGRKGIKPFFILGADTYSMDWLVRNKQFLIDQNIVRGLITNVPDGISFKRFTDAAAPLQLFPMNVDDLGNVFDVSVYPLVITQTEILQ